MQVICVVLVLAYTYIRQAGQSALARIGEGLCRTCEMKLCYLFAMPTDPYSLQQYSNHSKISGSRPVATPSKSRKPSTDSLFQHSRLNPHNMTQVLLSALYEAGACARFTSRRVLAANLE